MALRCLRVTLTPVAQCRGSGLMWGKGTRGLTLLPVDFLAHGSPGLGLLPPVSSCG